MPEWNVQVRQTQIESYLVEADTAEEAKQVAVGAYDEPVHMDTLEPKIIRCEEVKEPQSPQGGEANEESNGESEED